MEIYLLVLSVVVVYLAAHTRRTRKTVEALTEELEKQQIHLSAHRAAYNALFEEVRQLRRETKNKE